MRKSSKILLIALAVVAMVLVMTVGAMASGTSTAVVYGVAGADEANTFDVVYKFKENNTDVECGKITLTWDSTKISAESIVAGAALGDAEFELNTKNPGKAVIAWAGSAIDAKTAEGELFTVTFKKLAFAEGGVAAIDVSVDNFGYAVAFIPREFAGDVTANKVYASDGNFDGVWDAADVAAVTDPADFLSMAALEGVNVTLKADMEFTNGGYVNGVVDPERIVNITSELNSDGMPLYSIIVPGNQIVYFDGYYSFDDVNVKSTADSTTWFAGGCLLFNNGKGTFGHDDEDGVDFGKIGGGDGRLHLAGHVDVWTGTYYSVSGNYYSSTEEVVAPAITVGGNADVSYAVGGSFNINVVEGNITNKVEGEASVRITDDAKVSYVAGGSYYGDYEQDGGTVVVEGNSTVRKFLVAGFVGAAQMAEDAKYVLNISGGTIDGTTCGTLFNSYGVATVNTVINVSGGVFTGAIYGGAYTNITPSTDDVDKVGSVVFDGNTELNIDDTNGTINPKNTSNNVDVYGGSYIVLPESKHNAVSSLKIENINNKQIYVIAGSEFTNTSTGSEHIGKITFTATNVKTNIVGSSKFSNFRMGSNIKSASTHWGEIEATVTNCTGNDRLMGGSHLTHAGAVHFGDSTVTIKGNANSFVGGVIGGSFVGAGTHSGNSTVVFDFNDRGNTFTNQINGGSVLYGNTEHSGTSTVVIKCGTISSVIYGGSEMKAPTAKQTGDSTVVIDGNEPVRQHGYAQKIYGGSNASKFGDTLNEEAHEKGAYGHLANSSVEVTNGIVHNSGYIYGGSNLSYDTPWIQKGYFVQGAQGKGHKTSVTITSAANNKEVAVGNIIECDSIYASANLGQGGYQYANAEILSDTAAYVNINQRMAAGYVDKGATIVGDCKVVLKQYGLTFKGKYDGQVFGLFGGIYGNGNLIGDSYLEISGETSQLAAYRSGVVGKPTVMHVAGGSYLTTAGNEMTGDSTLLLDGTYVDGQIPGKGAHSGSNYFIPRIVAGGCIGNGIMTGDSTLTLKGDTQLVSTDTENATEDSKMYCLTAGCYGMNDLTTEVYEDTGIRGGIRQKGNVAFNVSDAVINDMKFTYVSGCKSNVDGNLKVDISGTPTFNQKSFTLGNGKYYSSITGDQIVYVSGGTFTQDLYSGGAVENGYLGNDGYNFVNGNSYTEISGGTFKKLIRAGGDGGVKHDTILKFVGDKFNVAPGGVNTGGVYSCGYGYGSQVKKVDGAREILDLSLVTDLTGDYAYFTKAWASSGPVGQSDRKGFSDVYPALADASTLTVTLAPTDSFNTRTAGKEFLIDADGLTITYAKAVNYHNGTTGTASKNIFEGTVGVLCEFDKYASSEAAKTINGLKTYDAATGEEFPVLPTYVDTVYIKVGGIQTPNFTSPTFRNSFRIAAASLTLGDSVVLNYRTFTSLDADGYTDYYLEVSHTNKETGEVEVQEIGRAVNSDLTPTVSGSGATALYSYYAVTHPHYMGDDYVAVLYAKDAKGNWVHSAPTVYGVYSYAQRNAKANALGALLVNMFEYGDAAQVYAEYDVENPCSEKANFTDEVKALVKPEREYSSILNLNYATIDNPTFSFAGANLTLKENITLNYIIAFPEGVTADDFSLKLDIYNVAGTAVDRTVTYTNHSITITNVSTGVTQTVTNENDNFGTLVNKGKTYYQLKVNELAPQELSSKVLSTIYVGDTAVSNTMSYSVESYAVGKTGTLGDLCKAIMKYSDAAKDYAAQ